MNHRNFASSGLRIAIMGFLLFVLRVTTILAAGWPGGTLVAYDFDISRKDAVVDQTFTIRDLRSYVLSLRFHYDGEVDLYRVLALVGLGSSSEHGGYGVPVHIRLSRLVNGADGQLIIDRLFETKSSFVHAFTPPDSKSGAFGREITTVNLQPGVYRIQANTIQDSVEFSGTPCQLAVEGYANLRFVPQAQ